MGRQGDQARIGAIDIGTTGVRFVLFDAQANPIASAYRELPLATPKPGWVEQDPEILLAATLTTLNEVLGHGRQAEALIGIGLTNQRETIVVWDKETGRPLHPAIVWQDRRTAKRCNELRQQKQANRLYEKTGLSLDPYFSATKIEWLLQNVPDLKARAADGNVLFGTVDSWLLWQLTGEHKTDDTNASRTLLYNINERVWDDELLALFDVPKMTLPCVCPSLSVFGRIKSGLIGAGVPIAGVLGDQQGSLLGQGIIHSGQAQVTWGTGAFLLMNTGGIRAHSRSGLLSTIARTSPDAPAVYALEGSVFVAGAAIQWLRDAMGLLAESADSQAMSHAVDCTDGVVFVPALTGLGSPHWDPDARGLIIGITRGTRREHLVRAALEAIAYQTHDVVRAMEDDTGTRMPELRVGGGAAQNDFLCQFQSDILGIPVIRPRHGETTAQGAAFAAGIAVGLWEGVEAVSELWQEDRRFEPAMSRSAREGLLGEWQRAVERAKGWCVTQESRESEVE
ncbi:MAG: glycerol kinase GlpK [Candidatus Atribacteria bacterium]|nr:MAG: glycerol kinase GlpK [Candidatus Atribacteria bacterium]